jgi:hypothetical protein
VESRYRPIDKRIDHWMATYSFNLVLLTLAGGGELRASELFTKTDDPAAWLRNSALQWQAAVPGDMWMDAMEVLKVTRTWQGDRRDITLRHVPAWTSDFPDSLNVDWITGVERGDAPLAAAFDMGPALRSMHLSNRLSDDMLLHALEPLIHRMPAAVSQFAAGDRGGNSAAHSIIRMWLAVAQDITSDELAATYRDAIDASQHLAGENVTELLLGAMRADAHRLPAQTVFSMVFDLSRMSIPTRGAAASAVHCLVASGAIRGPRGFSLACELMENHARGIGSRELIPMVHAIARSKGADRLHLRRLAMVLAAAGRRPEIESADPGVAEFLFAGM